MARLEHLATGRIVELDADTLIGRSPACRLRLAHESVSQVHASIRWRQNAWSVQDRNSTNGTWIDGVCLSRGNAQPIARGALLRFGSKRQEEWRLIDDGPPAHDEAPAASTAVHQRLLGDVQLTVRADLRLELQVQGEIHRLAARVPYVVLLELARERLQDRARGKTLDDEGWVDRETLARRLRRSDLNQDIHRIREDFRKLRLFEAAEDVIETHRELGKVRLGIPSVRVDD
jgi:hypothetical protein